MRRILAITICFACLTIGSAAVAADRGGKGAVQRAWTSETSGGPAVPSVNPESGGRIYVNFVWKTPPRAGQALRIGWRDPSGAIRAVWRDRSIASDKKGTRVIAWIPAAQTKASPGTWQAILTVGGVTRSIRSFRAVTAALPPPPKPPPAPPEPSPSPPNSGCDPNYEGACVPIVPYDLNCADIGAMVTVVGDDPNRFDADGDGYGCESYG
jgi:hypothetical protein